MKHVSYNVHAAIIFRSEAGHFGDDNMGECPPLSFKESVDLARNDQFMWGWSYPGEAMMQAQLSRANGDRVTREMWRKFHSGYRRYVRESCS